MAADDSWTVGNAKFNFAACGGTKLDDLTRQLDERGEELMAIWARSGGNNALFGDIARACIYQPRFHGNWGPPWDEDPDGKGYCKTIRDSWDYLEGNFAGDFRKGLDDILKHRKEHSKHPESGLDLYISSYVLFFNDETDDCDHWSFGHPVLSSGHPKLVKGLRKELNEATALLNRVQADVISNCDVTMDGQRVRHVEATQLYDDHRFCEPDHTFEDPFYGEDVWLWNLQYYDTKSDADGKEVPRTEDGVKFMTESEGVPRDLNVFPSRDERAETQSSQSAIGWLSRPFYPKWKGHEAMKNHFIQRMKDDRIPGVVGSGNEQQTCYGNNHRK